MKSEKFRICIKLGVTEIVTGYTFKWEGVRYGVTRSGNWWSVYELTTGLSVSIAGTSRKKAIETLTEQSREWIEAVRKAVEYWERDPGWTEDLNPMIDPIPLKIVERRLID